MRDARAADATFDSYYGRQVVRPPVWGNHIPAYLFTGGLAAGSSMLAAAADATGRPGLRRTGRLTSLGALLVSSYLLIEDLGRPARFYNMLRVAKPTSPMSVGTWILTAFGSAAGAAAAGEIADWLPETGLLGLGRRVLPGIARGAGWAAAGVAPALATYTAVLLADTASPAWHEAAPELPFLFAGSAVAAASGVGMMAAPLHETGPASRLALIGAGLELVAGHRVENQMGLLSEPYHTGAAGRLLRASKVLTVAGVAGALLGRRSRAVTVLSGAALVAASAATRFGVYKAGVASMKDPKYTVVPQRERLQHGGPVRADIPPQRWLRTKRAFRRH